MYAVVDIETTGTNNTYHGITEIAVVLHDGEKVTDVWKSLINPGQYIPDFITQMTGITNEMVESAPVFSDIAEELFSLLNDRIFVAHNAAFDYGFIRSHFEANGYTFKSKKLCTVRLSRKIFPGFRSYSLGKLCEQLGITIANRHRAFGDAEATAKVFTLLLENDPGDVINSFLKRNSKEQILPPHLDKQLISALPTEPGVYYFHDSQGKIIYVGKAKNIRSRVLGHFTFAEHHGRENALRDAIHDITFELTGNELIALLLESEEIKRKNPKFNAAQKLWDRNYCIFQFTDQNGYIHLGIERYNRKKDVLKVFPDFLSARAFLNSKVSAFQLCAKLCHLQQVKKECHQVITGVCKGACTGNEHPDDYNARVSLAIESFTDETAAYFILGKGRSADEKSAILIEKGHYLGFGFFQQNYLNGDPSVLRDIIRWRPDTPDVQRILTGWMSRYAVQILPLERPIHAE